MVFQSTASTNDLALRMAAGGEPEGTVIFAEEQTAGRGQYGRSWHSPRGLGLLFSVILRPPRRLMEPGALTLFTAEVMCEASHRLGAVRARIKPPNDILVEGRKLCGILIESRWGRDVFCVVGVGYNVLHQDEDFPPEIRERATSLSLETGRSWQREDVAAVLLDCFSDAYWRIVHEKES